MNNKISNQKTEVPQTNEMNDKDYITTILSIEKEIVKNYATAMTEASNDELCNDFHDMFDDVSDDLPALGYIDCKICGMESSVIYDRLNLG